MHSDDCVSNAFSVPMSESAPDMCVVTNRVPESEFDHQNRTPCPKVGGLVYKVSMLSKCENYLSITYLFYATTPDNPLRFQPRLSGCDQNHGIHLM